MQWVLSILMLSTLVHAETNWDWSQSVAYQENHDPSVVWLTDGRKLKVIFAGIPWKTVHDWTKGRSLLLAYNPESGVVIFDSGSGKSIPVLSGMEKHPIELLSEKCLKDNSTTMGMVECFGKERDRWNKEMNRAYKALRETLNDKQRKAVEESQGQWLKYRDSQIDAIYAVNDREGTIWRVVSAEQAMKVVREQAERLNSMME